MSEEMKNQEHTSQPEEKPEHEELHVKFVPWGPDQATIDRVSHGLIEQPAVQQYLKGTRHQMLSFALIDPEGEVKTGQIPEPPNRYTATFYDYTNNRAIVVNGYFDKPDILEISESGSQPLPSDEEFETAVKVLLEAPEFGAAIRERHPQVYRPMPPLIEEELPDGRIERTIAVGLLPSPDVHELRNEIVGVNMIHQTIKRFEHGAPEGSMARNVICGLPSAGQPTVQQGTAGQLILTVTQGNTLLWRFLVVRPAASSGINGSGIELRFVDYRGKRVLYRAHVPILNVRYDCDACGPYRDWQWQEGFFQANGTDIAPGFRFAPTPAQTILDSGTDAGNFRGVALYIQGLEVVLVSEMEAGWYRYISEWRFHVDGTIRPRFGFGAVQNSCVCNIHHHHAYWRLDFDIRTPGNNIVREYNNPPIIGTSNFHTKHFEIRRFRDPGHNRRWQVENRLTSEGYMLIPGPNDGPADSVFGLGDVWILHYHSNELDDGQGFTTNLLQARANLDKFINGESVFDQDVVIWYAAHFTHDIGINTGEIVGPELRPFNW